MLPHGGLVTTSELPSGPSVQLCRWRAGWPDDLPLAGVTHCPCLSHPHPSREPPAAGGTQVWVRNPGSQFECSCPEAPSGSAQ